jgi:uncharacterized protein YndB with AHSA1/START domain
MQDIIEQHISIKANMHTVYDAISNPIKIVTWFPSSIDGTLKTGDTPILDFGEHGKNQIRVVSANPHNYFAYRWVPGSRHYIGELNEENSTLVEFKLEEKDGFTIVHLTESGFANLPADQAERAIKENSGGWEYMLGRLQDLF